VFSISCVGGRDVTVAAGAHHDLRRLPDAAVAFDLHRTFGIMGLLCLLSTALFSRFVMIKATSQEGEPR